MKYRMVFDDLPSPEMRALGAAGLDFSLTFEAADEAAARAHATSAAAGKPQLGRWHLEDVPEPAEDRLSAAEGPGPGYAAMLVLRLRLGRDVGWAQVDLANVCARINEGGYGGPIQDAIDTLLDRLVTDPGIIRTAQLRASWDQYPRGE